MSDDRLAELFAAASALAEEGQRQLLARLRGEDPALADELARLLAVPDSAPSPIDRPPTLPHLEVKDVRPLPERVGPYRVVREIGRGGMGRVFLAEQETPDFSRRVAIKLIDGPAPYADAVRRFRDEVRILASLAHPGIVRFLDGGRTPDGTWFLALEYVEGEDLLAHATRQELDAEARTRLLLDVAEAVAYAHERGVVHRDLKPGNVLVGRDGRPRLLDFGISKLLDPAADAGPTTTAHGARPLTPAYASPEQLAGDAATPASDVYSLGVILYELLAGTRPRSDGGSPAGTSQPEPPSTAGRRRPPTDAATAGGAPGLRRPSRRRARDLDAICLRALRRDPAERYPDAGQLAADLRRFLERQPVAARARPAGGPLARAWARPGLRAALVAVPLLAIAALALWGWGQVRSDAGESASDAAVAATPAAPVRPGPFPLDPVNPPPVEESEARFAADPTNLVVGAELAVRLARDRRLDEARIALARLRQVPGAELDPLADFTEGTVAVAAGEHQRAQVFLTRARDNAIAQGRWELVGTIRLALGSTLDRLGHRDAAREELLAARALLARAGDHRPLYRSLVNLAALHYENGEIEQCKALYEEALRAARSGGFEPLVVLTSLAEVHLLQGRPDLAEPLGRQPLPELRKHPNPARPSDALTRLALIVRDLGRAEEAEALLAESIGLVEHAEQPSALADALLARSRLDLADGRLDRIDATVRQLEQLAVADVSRRPLAMARWVAAEKAVLVDDLEGARAACAEARRLFLADGYHDFAALAALPLAEAEVRAGETAAAVELLTTALAGFDEASAIAPRFFAELLLARIDAAAGRTGEARRRLAALGDGLEGSPSLSRRIAYLAARGAVAAAEGHAAAARRDLDAALAVATADGRKPAELELRLELAGLGGGRPEPRDLEATRREAAALGLLAIARRAAERAGAAAPRG